MKQAIILLICFFAGYQLQAQERFLRKAKSAIDDDNFSKAVSMVENYEGKEGENTQSKFIKFLILLKFGKTTDEQDEARAHLNYATASYSILSEKEKEEWCEEIDFCKDRFLYYQLQSDSMLFETYKQTNDLEKFSVFLTKYPKNFWKNDALIFKSMLAFNESKRINTEDGFLNYLKNYSEYPYSDSARILLHITAFAEAEVKNTIAAYTRFVNNYPKSVQFNDAKRKLWSLAWEEAVTRNKKSDYISFCNTYPDADQIKLAKEKIEQFDWAETRQEGTLEAYKKFTESYPKSIHFSEASTTLDQLKKRRVLEEALQEARDDVSGLRFSHAEQVLLTIDAQAPPEMKKTKDSLLARIKYLRPLLKQTLGRYIYISNGVEVIMVFAVSDTDSTLYCLFKSFSKGEPISGVESSGNFVFGASSGELNIEWVDDEYNQTMSTVTISLLQSKPILKLKNGTIYKKLSNDYESDIVSTVKPPAKTSTKKTYINMCGENYESGTDFSSFLPYGWEDRVGYYCLKNYSEGASSVWVSGANSNGILIKATGEVSGDTYTILYTCDGDLY